MKNIVTKYFDSAEDILTLVNAFRNRTLPSHQWTHEAHLVTGLWFNYSYSEHEAICYLRSGIISYNTSVGGENTSEKGYHETLTLFWSSILRRYVANNKDLSFIELCNNYLNSEWSSKDLPLKYYSRELLFSTTARAIWVNPDLKEL